MSRFKPFILGAMAGAAVVYTSLQYHVVHSNDGFYMVARAPQASMGLAYADIRNMSPEDLAMRPELARAMTAHSARNLLANNGSDAGLDSLTEAGSGMFGQARERLRSTTDEWNDLIDDGVPAPPNSSLDAPIWNPFADDSAPEEPDSDFGSISWPNDAPVASESNTPQSVGSPFSDTTRESDYSPFSDITDQLDNARDSFASQTTNLANQFQNQVEARTGSSGGVKPFDFAADTQPATTTAPAAPAAPTVETRKIPLLRDDQIRNSVSERARQIYEESRRRATQPIDSLIDRAESRASSVIDELVSPRRSIDELRERAAGALDPTAYRRGQ